MDIVAADVSRSCSTLCVSCHSE